MKRKVIIALVALLVISFLVIGLTPKDKKTSTDGSFEERIKALENEIAELKVLLKHDPGGDLKKDVVQDESKTPLGPRAWTEGARGWDENGVNIWTSVAPLPIYRVGIGTIAPFCELDVNGSIAVSGGIYDGASFGTDDYVLVADGAGAVAWEPSPAGVAGDYIWNQFTAAQNPGDFWIAGTGRAGATTGKYGELNHASYGVYGRYNASNYGFIGANGYGVYGRGSTYGVRGYYNASNYGYVGSNGIGVYGRGSTYGVYGYNSATIFGYIGDDSIGVYGRTNTGVAYAGAIKGFDNHDGSATSPKGVIGHATSVAGSVPFGVCGWTEGGQAYGVGGDFWGHGLNSITTPNRAGCGVFGAGRTGVLGVTNTAGYVGVYGFANQLGSPGVYGYNNATDGFGAVHGVNIGESSSSYGVYGLADAVNSVDCKGVYGYGRPVGYYGYGGYFYGGYRGVYGRSDGNGTSSSIGVYGYNSLAPGYGVYYSGGLGGSGSKSCIVRTSKGPTALYCQESPEAWFEDFGEGQLINGRAHIELDGLFLETVSINGEHPMKVFVQLTSGEPMNVVVRKGSTGFEVVAEDPNNTATFDYRVVAKRKGYEQTRLEFIECAYSDIYLYPDPNEVPAKWHAKRLAAEPIRPSVPAGVKDDKISKANNLSVSN